MVQRHDRESQLSISGKLAEHGLNAFKLMKCLTVIRQQDPHTMSLLSVRCCIYIRTARVSLLSSRYDKKEPCLCMGPLCTCGALTHCQRVCAVFRWVATRQLTE